MNSRQEGGSSQRRVLIVGHEASRSGAPRVLGHLVAGLGSVNAAKWSPEFLFGTGGALLPLFSEFGPSRVLGSLPDDRRGKRAALYRQWVDRPWNQPRRLRAWLKSRQGRRIDVVHNNTATNGWLLPALRTLGCPIVTHVHETDYSMSRFTTRGDLRRTLALSDHFIAVSQAVRDDLVNLRGVPGGRVTVVPNFLPALPALIPWEKARELARQSLGLPADSLLVTACGHLDILKGPDLWLQVAEQVRSALRAPCAFVWIGRAPSPPLEKRLRRETAARGLGGVVHWVGPLAEPAEVFGGSDVVVVPSRVESFSMVALEAGACGRPVVAFAGARGPGELLGPQLLAAGFDAGDMAARIAALLADPSRAANEGAGLRRLIELDFLAARRIPEILQVWEEVGRG